jgi:hypothetical protein
MTFSSSTITKVASIGGPVATLEDPRVSGIRDLFVLKAPQSRLEARRRDLGPRRMEDPQNGSSEGGQRGGFLVTHRTVVVNERADLCADARPEDPP